MATTLKCPKKPKDIYMGRDHAGYILIAEPTSETTVLNSHLGQSLMIRPAKWYVDLFTQCGFDIIAWKQYDSYVVDNKYEINAERVWLL